ncbi:MAG: antitoxin VbhA family protein [Syntrophomonadaceae bacterium]
MPKKASEIKRVMNSIQASMAVEGLKPSKRAKAISQKYLEGKLDSEEAVTMIIAHHRAKRKNR